MLGLADEKGEAVPASLELDVLLEDELEGFESELVTMELCELDSDMLAIDVVTLDVEMEGNPDVDKMVVEPLRSVVEELLKTKSVEPLRGEPVEEELEIVVYCKLSSGELVVDELMVDKLLDDEMLVDRTLEDAKLVFEDGLMAVLEEVVDNVIEEVLDGMFEGKFEDWMII